MHPDSFLISKQNWDRFLKEIINENDLCAPLESEGNNEYQLIQEEKDISRIVYNHPKPTSPLKTFFLPVKENVTIDHSNQKLRIILGVPSCDLAGLGLLDEMYLQEPLVDPYYQSRRENTLLIGTDCHSTLEHCHCTSYGINPFPEVNFDLGLVRLDDQFYVYTGSEKGKAFINRYRDAGFFSPVNGEAEKKADAYRERTIEELKEKNSGLPGYEKTGELIRESGEEIWKKYSRTCVSCGACATICPTCTCFLLIDRTGFEKVRNLDACQYPGFERVAAGEDPLGERHIRFRNRYLCKYVWKPQGFESIACTGCGRCIEACIGKINKNELFEELSA
ncbi:MAG: 4Fe-4S dicluster domain-containing protein [Bacteroidales bacterium]